MRTTRALPTALAAVTGAALGIAPAMAAASPPVPVAYVTDNLSNSVTIVQGTVKVGVIAKVGSGPTGIAVSPDGATAYVADYGFSGHPAYTLTPIDLSTRTPEAPIDVGLGPYAVAVTPDGSEAVVTLEGTAAHPGHQIVVVNLSTRSVSAPVYVGLNPESVALSPDGHTAFVAAMGSAKVVPVDLTTLTAGKAIQLPGTSPRAIALTPDGKTAYVLDSENAKIIPIDTTTGMVGKAVDLGCVGQGSPGCTPAAITVNQTGTVAYVAAAGSADLLELSLPSLEVTKVLPTGSYPDAVGVFGNWVYSADGAGNDVTAYHFQHATTVPGGSYPFGMAVVP